MMGTSADNELDGRVNWSPHAPPPTGVTLDNLRRRGIDLLRFHLHAPHRTGKLLRTAMNIAVVPFIAWCLYANWLPLMLVALFCLAIVAQQFEANKIDGNWTISFTPKKLSISKNKGEDESEVITDLDPADIKSIEIQKSRTSSRHSLKISSSNAVTVIGNGLSKEALVWLKNYLIMEVSGRAWRPLYSVDRSVSRTTKTELAANPTLMGQDLAIRLIEIYRDEAPMFIEQLGAAVEKQDAVGIRQNAHWLKSASAHIGAKYMSESCQVMQIYGMDNDLSRTHVLFKEIERTNTELMRWLEDVSDVSSAAGAHLPPAPSLPTSENLKSDINVNAGKVDSSGPSNSSDIRILIIDDSSVSREIARNFLDDISDELVFAEDGQAALDICNTDKFDLILTDCEMFGMDGYEFARQFRLMEAQEDGTRTPIVALTAHALKGDRARCLEAGMDDYLSKPYTIEELHNKIEKWVNQKAASYYDAPIKVAAIA